MSYGLTRDALEDGQEEMSSVEPGSEGNEMGIGGHKANE